MTTTTSTTAHDVSTDETMSLIGSDKVEGTTVYGANGDNLGRIERVMIDKRSGRVAFAVLSFGGFLGFGEKQYPLPWEQLTYDSARDGYVVGLTAEQLEGAPSYGADDDFDWTSAESREGLRGYYDRHGRGTSTAGYGSAAAGPMAGAAGAAGAGGSGAMTDDDPLSGAGRI